MRVSIVIRTLNEARYLPALMKGIRNQHFDGAEVEPVVIDSGSSDGTLEIAREFDCVLTHIERTQFSFGRSLNMGCEAASGDVLVFVSGHCVPTDEHWLRRLCLPIFEGMVDYTYGRQLGGPESRFSECRIFEKYFPPQSRLPQVGFFCNNANSALSRAAWRTHRFDEELTGLEDMELAQRLCNTGGKVGYVAEAAVYHYHHESWPQVRRRFEREAIALQRIMPQIQMSPLDLLRYISSSIVHDLRHGRREGRAASRLLPEVARYRWAQYTGSFRGNHQHRKLSRAQKDLYFYPSNTTENDETAEIQSRRTAADEGEQRPGARQELPRVLR
jgi:cellulose synthase/poly-beta-1,6-N-acetylglucosamine synthase-like glycosyltransferase